MGRGEVEVDVLVAGPPAIALGLVGPQVVEDDVDLLVGIVGDHLVHEVEELGAPPALAVLGLDLTGGDLERREQGGRAAAPVLVRLIADIAKLPGEQRRGPAGEPCRRRPVERGQDAPVDRGVIGLGLARARRVGEPGEPVAGKPHPPFADHPARAADLACDPPAGHAGRREQHHPRPLDQPVLDHSRAHPALQRGPLIRRQHDQRRLSNRHANRLAWHTDFC